MARVLKTVKELCLVCGGERWVADPADPARSVACPYCDALGWVEVSLPSLGEREEPSAPPPPKPSAPPPRKPR
ncbi:MAG TPA: hypothetical protein VNZ54_09765 [bacterium]|jgi:hypothetical protein|nr:hypothetical protein [bacterium]